MLKQLLEQQDNMSYINKRRKLIVFLRFYFILPILIISLSSCVDQTDRDKVAKLVQMTDTMPAIITYNLKVKYSERGNIKIIVSGPEAYNYEQKKCIVFPKGINVDFYDNNMNIKTTLTADYGISYDDGRRMEAKNNVILINHIKNEVLNTDHLIWNQNDRKIFSDQFVKITTPTNIIRGDEGFISDETFDNWRIIKPSGNFKINENE